MPTILSIMPDIFSPVRIVHAHFPRDSIGKKWLNTTSLVVVLVAWSDSLVSGTRFITLMASIYYDVIVSNGGV